MIDVENDNSLQLHSSVAKMHKRVMSAVELQLTQTEVPLEHSHFVRFCIFPPRMYYIHFANHTMPNELIIFLNKGRRKKKVFALAECSLLIISLK